MNALTLAEAAALSRDTEINLDALRQVLQETLRVISGPERN